MSFAEYVRVINDLYTLETLYVALIELDERFDNNIMTFVEYTNNYLAITEDIKAVYAKHNCPILIEIP